MSPDDPPALDPAYPPALDPASRPPVESAVEAARRRRRADRARQALVSPWSPERARRVRLIALALVIIGPVAGTLLALRLVPDEPADIVAAEPSSQPRIEAEATVRAVDPANGEMMMRLVLRRPDDLLDRDDDDLFDDTVLADDLYLVVNDAGGQNIHELPAGQVPGSIGVSVALTGSRVTRYPLDRYRSTLLIQVRRGDAEGEPLPVRLRLRSSDAVFVATTESSVANDAASAVTVKVQRRWTVIGWTGFFVLLSWLLAVSAASIGWITVAHGVASPAWSWGFLIGVLFALPPLRNALPGNPPGGALVDIAAFYWAVGIVVLTLTAMIGSWNVRVRRAPHQPDAPRP